MKYSEVTELADEIGEAMQRVGGTAGAIGLEFEKVSSWIANVSARTRESAFTIGKILPHILVTIYVYLL